MVLILGNNNDNPNLNGFATNDDIFGLGGDDILRGLEGSDLLEGGKGNDSLDGGENGDLLRGGVGNDTLDGGNGNDVLIGGAGNDILLVGDAPDADILTGGAGRDAFKFDILDPLIDPTITDFTVTKDVIQVDRAQFFVMAPGVTRLPLGTLAADQFHVGAGAANANDYFIYNKVTGTLSFDRDGSKSGPGFVPVQIAQLSPGLEMTNANIVIV